MEFEDNIIKLKSNFADDSDFSMGSLIDVDYTEYNAKEIHFHTPAEHSLNGKSYPMEVQVIFNPAQDGDFKKKAVLSFMVESVPGGSNKLFDQIDFLDLPNALQPKLKLPGTTDINL